MFFQDFDGVLRRVPGMNNHRQIQLFCQFQLLFKHRFLDVPVRFRPVVIQADFAHRHHFGVFQYLPDGGNSFLGVFVRLFRVVPGGGVHKGIFFRVFQGNPGGFHIASAVDDAADALLRQGSEHCLPVLVEAFIVIMGVGIKNPAVKYFCLHDKTFLKSADFCAGRDGIV